MTNRLLVAAVQIDCQPGQVQENLRRAERLVEDAVQQGAQLVLLPELMPGGYLLDEDLWNSAEPWLGPTCSWITALSKRLGIYLGTSFLEAEGEDFYNTFVLAAPEGNIAGKVRKSPPASLEAYFFRAGNTSHVIETGFGRVGVGICYENLLYSQLNQFVQSSADLVLQPAAAGRPMPMRPGDVELFDRTVERIAPRYAKVLGVPVVMANRTGPIKSLLPAGMGEFVSSFPGRSQIVDSDASIKAKMGEEEGVIVAEVHLDPDRKRNAKPRCFEKMWALPVPWYAYIWPLTQKQGEVAYAQNDLRKQRALKICR